MLSDLFHKYYFLYFQVSEIFSIYPLKLFMDVSYNVCIPDGATCSGNMFTQLRLIIAIFIR